MDRSATAHLELTSAGAATLILSVGIADRGADERLRVRQSGRQVDVQEVEDLHGTRLHVAHVGEGPVVIDYEVHKSGTMPPATIETVDEIRYLRPSRYCESDTLLPIARSEFAGLAGRELLDGVTSWVGRNLSYVPGSSLPTDGAVRTLLSRSGVCRDYAHLVIALLRALDVPARLVSVYAPGLDPMDFHAVAEALVEGAWHVVDATALAPRQTLLRIATGRDASDAAFLTTHGGKVVLEGLEVSAVADELPRDDVTRLRRLA